MRKQFVVKAARSNAPKLSQTATQIADLLSDWLGEVSDLDNVEDYLDEYDMEHLDNSVDALYDFAKAYATDMNEIE